ncbi:ABC transporter ATP-binding protein [Proteobacteria bacterium 005FR1]|nr:ABC transporter ATP-binding protein [Proteobacteria bacterium 005FR1]
MNQAVSAKASPLTVDGLRKRYGGHEVLRGVDLQLAPGAIHGLVGLNGAGKTTTLQCILGLLPYDGGEVSVLGLAPAALHRCAGKVAVVFDEPCLHPHLTVGETLRHAALLTGAPTHDLAGLEKLLGIERYHDFKVRQLSLGNRRRTSIAQALVGDPCFLLLDEPFNGLDAGGVDDLLELIARLNRERGIAFMLASHQLSYLEQVCSHLAILHQGRIAVSDSVETLLGGRHARLALATGDQVRARALLEEMEGLTVCGESQSGLVCELRDISAAAVNRALVTAGIDVFELRPQRSSLDALFREVTGRGGHD